MTRILVPVLLFISLLLINMSPAYSAEWKLLISTETSKFYVDAKSFKHENSSLENHYILWLKVTYNQLGMQEYIAYKKSSDLQIDGYDDFSHSIWHLELKHDKYSNRLCRDLGLIDYNKSGFVLDGGANKNPTWEEIPPDSIMDRILNVLEANV